MEAVHNTMRVIVKALENTKDTFRYGIDEYRKLLD
jgi:hypothetical protein